MTDFVMTDHVKYTTPKYILLVQYINDTCDVLCHWHEIPEPAIVEEFVQGFLEGCDKEQIVGFFFAKSASELQRIIA